MGNGFVRILKFHDFSCPHASPPRRGGNHVTKQSDCHQHVGYFSCAYTDNFMPLFLIRPKFEHIAQHGHLVTVQLGQQVEGCQSGFRRGIVCIVEQQGSAFSTDGCQT